MMIENKKKDISIKELVENQFIEIVANSAKKKKSANKVLNTLAAFEQLNNGLKAS